MSADANRLSRIKSLIDRDMRSVHARSAPQLSQQEEAERELQQRRQQLEAQDLAIRADAQKQRQQRKQQHRQQLLSEAAQQQALQEQKQKQETFRRQKENAEKQKLRQQMRNTVSSPQEMQRKHEREHEGGQEKDSEPAVLDLTQLVRQGPDDQQHATLSGRDAKMYSPFAHTQPFRATSQKSSVRNLSGQLLNFFFAPFLLLGRTVLFPYRIVRSFSNSDIAAFAKPNSLGARHTIATAGLACWHFATAPLHLLAHAVLDPLGLFTPQPESYPRLPPLLYARIFVQQIKRNVLVLLRSVGRLAGAVAGFLVAPFLLLANVVLMPWRSVRYGTVRNVVAIVAESGARLWRKMRIRSVGISQLLRWRSRVVFRAQRERSRKVASEGRLFMVRVLRKELAQARRNLPALWRAQRERIRRSLARLSRSHQSPAHQSPARRTGNAHGSYSERPSATTTRPDAIPPAKDDAHEGRDEDNAQEKEKEKTQEKAKEEDKSPSVATGKTGLFSESEHSLLEDFFANDEEGGQDDMDAFLQAAHGKEAEKPAPMPSTPKESEDRAREDRARENREGEDKEAVYREMDTLRSAMQEGIERGGQDEKQDEKKTFQKIEEEVEEMDEQTRAKLLHHLSRRVEEEKLR